jgi:hypothetical protein
MRVLREARQGRRVNGLGLVGHRVVGVGGVAALALAAHEARDVPGSSSKKSAHTGRPAWRVEAVDQ